jgi:hypothetical protein
MVLTMNWGHFPRHVLAKQVDNMMSKLNDTKRLTIKNGLGII